jgi:hypothetical protein
MMQRSTTLFLPSVGLCVLLLVTTAAHGTDPRLPSGHSPWESAQRHQSNYGHLPLLPAQDTVWCFCPAVICSHGKEAGCTAACYAPKSPRCRCETKCDLYAKPVGSNLCRCE